MALVALASLAGCGGNDDDVSPPGIVPDPAAAELYADGAAIRQLGDYINNAFAASPEAGRVALASSNYLVWDGTYAAEQCVDYFRSQGGYLAGARYSENFVLDTLTRSPGRVIDAVGGVPAGRVYTISAVLAWNGQAVPKPVTIEVTVLPDGNAKSFTKCA